MVVTAAAAAAVGMGAATAPTESEDEGPTALVDGAAVGAAEGKWYSWDRADSGALVVEELNTACRTCTGCLMSNTAGPAFNQWRLNFHMCSRACSVSVVVRLIADECVLWSSTG